MNFCTHNMNDKEQWKPIPQYEELYEVSDKGNVRSIAQYTCHHTVVPRPKPRIVKAALTHDGYVRVTLSNHGVQKHFTVHRLVALAFIPNTNHLPQVNHKDENPQNNSVDNLEWCTGKQNCNYGKHCQRIKERLALKNHLAKPVARLDRDGDVIEIYKSVNEAARQMGVRGENISRCCNGRYSHSCGYGWKYVDMPL